MNFRTTLILLIVLVVVVAWLLVDRYTGGPAPLPQAASVNPSDAGKPLFTVKPDDVEEISVTPAEGSEMVMKRSGTDWRLSRPVDAAAESWQVDSLVRDITGLKTRGQVAAGIDTGLEHPRYRVELTAKDGKTIRLAVGDKTAIGDAMYVRVGDQKEAQVVPSDAWTELSRPVSDYRDKGLVNVSSEQIKQLSIEREGKPKIVLVKEGTHWRMTEPRDMPVDEGAAGDLVFAISGAQVKKYVPPDRARPQLTLLDHPRLVVWYSTAVPSTQPTTRSTTRPAGTTIDFGGYDSVLKENVFARVGAAGEVVTLPATTLDSFNKTPLELRDKKVLDISPDKVEKLSLAIDKQATTRPTTQPASHTRIILARRPTTPAVLGPARPSSRPAATRPTSEPTTQPASRPTPSTWVLDGTYHGDADDSSVTTLLGDLNPLRTTKYLEDRPDTHAAATYTLVIRTNDGATHTLKLFDNGPDGKLLGQLGDLNFELDRSLLDALNANFRKAP